MTKEAPQEVRVQRGGLFKELVKFILIVFLIVVPFRLLVAQPFIVNGASMDPTFHPGEYLIVDQISYRLFEGPQRGSVIIFRHPPEPSKFFIKRVIGLPGETLEIKSGQITVKNLERPEGFQLNETYIIHPKDDSFSIKLAEDEYFVMGDNRAGSSDSRIWGPLPRKYIIGRPIVRLFPINKIAVWPGRQPEVFSENR